MLNFCVIDNKFFVENILEYCLFSKDEWDGVIRVVLMNVLK